MELRRLESLDGMLDIRPQYYKEEDSYGITIDIKLDYRRKMDSNYKLENDTEYMNYLSVVNNLIKEIEEGLKEGLRETCEKTLDKMDKEIYYNIDSIKTMDDEK